MNLGLLFRVIFPLPLLDDLVAVRSCMARRYSQALPQDGHDALLQGSAWKHEDM